MSVPVHQPGARNAVLRAFQTAEWLIVAAVIIAAALVVDPALRSDANVHMAVAAYLLLVLVLARLRWLLKDDSARLLSGIVLAQIGIALQNYESAQGVLPPGTIDETGPIRSEPSGCRMTDWLVT